MSQKTFGQSLRRLRKKPLAPWLLLACLWSVQTHARNAVPIAPSECPASTVDYGSGMVAIALPKTVAERLNHEHARIERRLTKPTREPYASAQFAPHISLVYGLSAERVETISAFLYGREKAASPGRICLGKLHYWDNQAQKVTSIVVDVEDTRGALSKLHEQLQSRLGEPARFAYHPHITLAFVTLGKRLSADEEAALLGELQSTCWQPQEVYWTNRCGQRLDQIAWDES